MKIGSDLNRLLRGLTALSEQLLLKHSSLLIVHLSNSIERANLVFSPRKINGTKLVLFLKRRKPSLLAYSISQGPTCAMTTVQPHFVLKLTFHLVDASVSCLRVIPHAKLQRLSTLGPM